MTEARKNNLSETDGVDSLGTEESKQARQRHAEEKNPTISLVSEYFTDHRDNTKCNICTGQSDL